MFLILLIFIFVFIFFFCMEDGGIDTWVDEADQLDEMDFLIEEWDREDRADAGRNAFSDEFDDHWDDF